MFLLGHHLPDNQKIRLALTGFYGLSYALSSRLCARLSLHDAIKVGDLTDSQVTQISAYLSSPGSIGAKEAVRTRGPLEGVSEGSSSSSSTSQTASASASKATLQPPSQRSSPAADPMRSLLLESDLRRAIRANINHHRQIGTYRGRRHSQGLPVRGQRTSSNALTARKLNKIERRAFTTMAGDVSRSSPRPTVTSLLAALKRPIF